MWKIVTLTLLASCTVMVPPKYRYLDCVEVVSGFYAGVHGHITQYLDIGMYEVQGPYYKSTYLVSESDFRSSNKCGK